MSPKHKRRLIVVILVVASVGIAVTLALNALNENLMYFYSPSEVIAGNAPDGRAFRLGGLVREGSMTRDAKGLAVRFDVTDTAQDVTVEYTGILPDLFREGQGIVALGRLDDDGVFVADQVLAKHDENYMPPEVNQALQQAGAASPHAPERRP